MAAVDPIRQLIGSTAAIRAAIKTPLPYQQPVQTAGDLLVEDLGGTQAAII